MVHKQLFCFTYAGGTASFFDFLKDDLKELEIVGFEYAGHGKRHSESFYKDFDELADDLFALFKERFHDEEYALFGYSMGTISLVEVLKRIQKAGMQLPSNVFLAAHEPMTKSELSGFSEKEDDEVIINRTIRFGGVPEKLLSNKVFWRTYLPIYRADYSIIGKYEFEKLDLKLNIPATVFYSETDTDFSKMKLWGKYFPCEFYQFPGTHFFALEHHKEIGIIIKEKMGVADDI